METCQCKRLSEAVKNITIRTLGTTYMIRPHEPIPYCIKWGKSTVDPYTNLEFDKPILYPTKPEHDDVGVLSPRWIPAGDYVSQKWVGKNENNNLLERPF